MRRRPEIGHVFIVPTGDGRAGVGQVVATYGQDAAHYFYYFAIFDFVVPLEEATDRALDALRAPVLFLALSTDAKLYAGHWTIVGAAPVDTSILLPAYKEAVGTPYQIEVVDYSGDRRRAATPSEAAVLPNRKVVAPVRLERALRATLGLEPWLDAFNELRADNVVPADSVFR